MEGRKRKRLQGRHRMRKFRALSKAANRPSSRESSSSTENSSLEDVNNQYLDGGREMPLIDHGSIDSDNENGNREVASDTLSSENPGTGNEANASSNEEHYSLTSPENSEGSENESERENEHSLDTAAESEDTNTNSIQEESSEDERISDSSSQSEVADDENQDYLDIQRLRIWAIDGKIDQVRVDELLQILRQRLLPDLPKSAKTFLYTSSAKYTIEDMEDSKGNVGEFVYFGIKSGLEACIDPDVHTGNLIELKFSVDGLPLTNSGDEDFWPHLCQVHFNPDIYKPFPISIFCGKGKPASTDVYFTKFVDEINDLLENGIDIAGKHFTVQVKCFVCDTPARAFCKNTVGHTGKHACERCTVKGTKKNISRTVFPSIDSAERSDESFRNQTQAPHHNGRTKLLDIRPNIDMIFTFILDYMHLCCLGIMKKLIEWWLFGDFNVRLGPRMRDLLSDRMELLKSQVPCEFQRKPASTKKFKKWKATQFYFFLLYCGPVVLKNILTKRLYKHILLLHGACRVLCSDNVCLTLNQYAKRYLIAFFVGLKDFYGKKSQVLNSHNLIHLADDVRIMGCSLIRISAFVFESFLGKLKKKLRTPNKPLAQVCRRIHEENSVSTQKANIPAEIQIVRRKENNISKIRYKQYTICNHEPDNIVLLNNKQFLKVTRIYETDGRIQINGFILKKKKSIFDYPFESSLLNMWEVDRKPSRGLKTYFITSIESKVVKMSITLRYNGSKHVFVMPFLHKDM